MKVAHVLGKPFRGDGAGGKSVCGELKTRVRVLAVIGGERGGLHGFGAVVVGGEPGH